MNAVLRMDPDSGRICAPAGTAWDETFRRKFARVRSDYCLYPQASGSPSAALESVAGAVRSVASDCLPLGLAVVMHLYPLCALQCAPLPRLSLANFKRNLLMKMIRDRSLIVANGGSERASGAHEPMAVTVDGDELRVSGTFQYVSLASVADLLFFSAPLGDRTVFCAAGLQGDSVRVGASKFQGRMQLSDTHALTFTDHRLPRGRYLLVDDAPGASCIFDYQRCWFHLLLADAYLARIEHLRRQWELPGTDQHRMAFNEVSCLREYSLRLLDECRPHGGVERLSRVTAALKLRVSTLAQTTGRQLRDLQASARDDAASLAADADELGYMKLQPTSDERILRAMAGETGNAPPA